MTTGADIAAAALKLKGTRYHHGAAVPGVGCDCIGVVRASARMCGLVDPFETGDARKYEGYTASPNPILLLEACDRFMDRILVSEVDVGDVLLFRFAKAPQHFGIVSRLDPMYVVHSYMQTNEVVENIVDRKWSARIVGAYRLRGVE